jgi:C4-dicarboxylate-specific signal transduction histidine kinase
MGMLTAAVAHEVNQPLSAILINASTRPLMLGDDPPRRLAARALPTPG